MSILNKLQQFITLREELAEHVGIEDNKFSGIIKVIDTYYWHIDEEKSQFILSREKSKVENNKGIKKYLEHYMKNCYRGKELTVLLDDERSDFILLNSMEVKNIKD